VLNLLKIYRDFIEKSKISNYFPTGKLKKVYVAKELSRALVELHFIGKLKDRSLEEKESLAKLER